MNRYAWTLSDDNSQTDPDEPLPAIPGIHRYAVAEVFVPVTTTPPGVTVADLHPQQTESWGTWAFPQITCVIDAPVGHRPTTFRDLSAVLYHVLGSHREDLRAAATRLLSARFATTSTVDDHPVVWRNFMLTHPVCAPQWTAAVTNYREVAAESLTPSDAYNEVIPVTGAALSEITWSGRWTGRPLSGTVAAYLASRFAALRAEEVR